VAEGDGLLNADQHFGHRGFSSQIIALQSLPRASKVGCYWLWRPDLGRPQGQFQGQSLRRLIHACDLGRRRHEILHLVMLSAAVDSRLSGVYPRRRRPPTTSPSRRGQLCEHRSPRRDCSRRQRVGLAAAAQVS